MAEARWEEEEDGSYRYYYSDGTMATGWISDDSDWYYLYGNGIMATGWICWKGDWYYLYPGGSMARNGPIPDSTYNNGFDLDSSTGKMVNGTGWLHDGITGDWYYYSDGSMVCDHTIDGYHLNSSGKMITGTGWEESDGSWYYLKDDGSVVTNSWLYDEGNWYYLYKEGSMAHATWINEYYVDDNGEWKHTMDKNYDSENIDSSDSSDTHNTYEEPRWNDKVVSYIKGTQRFQWFRQETQEGGLKSFFDVSGFDRDENGVYHAKQDAIVQSRAGYNDFYDDVFNLGCSMNKGKYEFSTSSGEYIVWIWKGDYLNLGAGAEIGIYKGGGPWWGCDIEDAMPMTLRVEDKEGNLIIDWKPTERNWWCTGFNPDPKYQNMQQQNLTVYGSIDFSKHLDMWDAFYEKWNGWSPWILNEKPIAKFIWK